MKKCKACKGNGWIIVMGNEIQRCDGCAKFDGDLSAAQAFFKSKTKLKLKFSLDRILIKGESNP